MVYRPGTLNDDLVLARNNQKIRDEIRNANRPTGTMWNDTTRRVEGLEAWKEELEQQEIVFTTNETSPEDYELFCSLNTPGGVLYVHKRIEET